MTSRSEVSASPYLRGSRHLQKRSLQTFITETCYFYFYFYLRHGGRRLAVGQVCASPCYSLLPTLAASDSPFPCPLSPFPRFLKAASDKAVAGAFQDSRRTWWCATTSSS